MKKLESYLAQFPKPRVRGKVKCSFCEQTKRISIIRKKKRYCRNCLKIHLIGGE